MRSHELFRTSTPSTSPRRVEPEAFDGHQSPFGSHPPTFNRPFGSEEPRGPNPARLRPPWKCSRLTLALCLAPRSLALSCRPAADLRRVQPPTSASNRSHLRGRACRPLAQDQAPKSLASCCRPVSALRRAPKPRRRETASRLQRDRCCRAQHSATPRRAQHLAEAGTT